MTDRQSRKPADEAMQTGCTCNAYVYTHPERGAVSIYSSFIEEAEMESAAYFRHEEPA